MPIIQSNVFGIDVREFAWLSSLPAQTLDLAESFTLDLSPFIPPLTNVSIQLDSGSGLPTGLSISGQTITGTTEAPYARATSGISIVRAGYSDSTGITFTVRGFWNNVPNQVLTAGDAYSLDLTTFLRDPSGATDYGTVEVGALDDNNATGVDADFAFTANVSGNDWLPSTLDSGSDVALDPNLSIGRLRWSGTQLLMNRTSGSTEFMSAYWEVQGNDDAKSVYFLLAPDELVEVIPAWFDDAGGGFVRWNVPSGAVRTALNGVSSGDRVLVVVADEGSVSLSGTDITLGSGQTLPAGVDLNDGVLSGTPTTPAGGRNITFDATKNGITDDTDVRFTVEAAADPPMWDTIPEQYLVVGETVSLNMNSFLTAPSGTVVSLATNSEPLPVGLNISGNQVTGTVDGVSDDVTFTVTFTARTQANLTANVDVDFTVLYAARGDLIATSTALSISGTDYIQIGNQWTVETGVPSGFELTNQILDIPNGQPDRYYGLWATLEISDTEEDAVMIPLGRAQLTDAPNLVSGRDQFTLSEDDMKFSLSSGGDRVDAHYVVQPDGSKRLVLASDSVPSNSVVKLYAAAL